MTSDLFNYFNGKYIDPTYRSSSAARARLKAWDQRHESQPSWEEDFYDYESSEQVWDEVTCGQSVMGVDDCGILPEEKWEYIKNPSLSTKEIWQLFADESADERADRYGHRYDDIEACWGYDPYDPFDYYDYGPYDDDYDPYGYDPYEDGYPIDHWQEQIDSLQEGFFLHELEKESEKYIEDCKVWSETAQEIARFEESCDPPQPEPRPLISDHHYRKAA